ncbi:hypothetical protein G9A89_006680 [Geosiphon pyriformis]|nr:hypothetical protein G9A89_006680 [Geosiphon pyriformis]
MSLNSSTANATSTLDWLEGTLLVTKENLAIFPATEYSKVAELVKKYLVRNQKTPENLFDCLNNPKRWIDNILLGFSLEHGIGTIPNLTKAFLKYQKAANAKDSLGQFFLGRCYDTGTGTSQDQGKAYELYSKAAEAGNAFAQYNLAVCYLNGEGTTRNSEKAFELYSKAAEAGHLDAQYNLAFCYANGEGTTKDSEKAFELFSKAAEAGHLNAQYNLAVCYANGEGTMRNSEKAFELYSKAAEAGDLDAQYNLAFCYANGEGTTKDSEKAFDLFSKAAEAGHLNAQNNLALCYLNGEGTTKDSEKAFELFSKAAEAGDLLGQIALRVYHRTRLEITEDLEKEGNPSPQTSIGTYHRKGWEIVKYLEETFQFYLKTAGAGNQNAQYNLGWSAEAGHLNAQYDLAVCYANGEGTMRNSEKAFELYSKAAEAGDLDAQYNLAFRYANGEGTTKDSEKAFELFSKAAEAGHLNAQYNLALCYANGEGTMRNSEKAFELYSKAAEAGDLDAQYNLAFRYANGEGTTKDSEKAFELFSKAAEAGHLNAQYNLALYKVGEGGFGIVKKGSWEIGKILFWEKKSQKYERTGVTKVALKYLKDSQNIKYINPDEFISHHQSATCKYILECYGITKDITTDEYVMVLPFAEHGDLRAFLKLNKDILIWDMFLRILFQIAGGLRFIHKSKLVHGDLHPGNILVFITNPLKVVISDLGLCRPADDTPQSGKIYGVLEYLVPEIFEEGSHTKYRDIYSFAIISCEIISGERPFNNTDPINVVHDVIKGKRPTIKKHTLQCIQEIIEKNWQYDPSCRDSAEELQQKVIAARDNCH